MTRRLTAPVTAAVLLAWLLLPFLPLALWAFADRWSWPNPLPTQWGFGGVASALDQGAIAALGQSLALGLLVAVFATPLGAAAAWGLATGAVPAPRLVAGVLAAPIALPALIAVLGMNVVLLRAGVPPTMGIVLVLTAMALPYTTYSMRVAFAAHDVRFEDEARTLGASRWHVLTRVRLPLMAPALSRSAFLAFLVGWSDYVVTLVVGGGDVISLPMLTASSSSGIGNDAMVAVLSLAAIVPPIVLLALLGTTAREPGTDHEGAMP